MAKFTINIDNISLGGFAPAWYKESYPSFGNKNTAGAMTNIDMTNPGFMTQGPGLSNLTNGTEAGALVTLPKGILDMAVTSNSTYATGGNKLYILNATTISSQRTIDKAAVTAEDGEDVAYYKGNLYYSYNHSGSLGDIGQYDLASAYDDDYMSTVPTGANTLTGGVPHQMVAAGNDYLYITNGIYVSSFDGTTFVQQDLDLPTNTVIQSIAWHQDKLWIAAIRPNLSGANKITGSIYIWDGTSDSWEMEIKVMGRLGALHVKNGTLFVWYQDQTSTGGYKIGYVNGGGITDIANFTGGLPAFYQVTDYLDFILFVSSGDIWAFGSGDTQLPVRLFQIADGGYTTIGGLACPFGTPFVASNQTTSYRIAKFSGYDTNASWKSINYDITGGGRVSKIDGLRINFEQLTTNARVDWKLVDNKGKTVYPTPASGNTFEIISHSKLGAVTSAYYPLNGLVAENFRLEFDFTNGNVTNAVKIKNARITGSID